MEMTSFNRPRLNPSRQMRIRAYVRAIFTILVLVSVPIVMLLLFAKESTVRFVGIVDSGYENVGPVDASRIVSVDVKQGDVVKAGDILVRFDSAKSVLEEQMKNLQIRELEHRLHSRLDNLIETERKCRQALVSQTEKYQALDRERIRNEAELRANSDELRRIDSLIAKKLISEKDVLKVRPVVLSLREIVKHYPQQLQAVSNSIATLKRELEDATLCRQAGEKEVAAGLVAVKEAFDKSEEIRRADPGVMRALQDGTVSGVFHRPGDIVTADEPVLRLQKADESVYITGLLTLGMQDAVKLGDTVWVTRRANGHQFASQKATVVAVDAEMRDLFASPSDKRPSSPMLGRKVRIRVNDPENRFVSGEYVDVTDAPLDNPLSWFSFSKGDAE